MKFNEISDCDDCPLKGEYCQSSHPDAFHPCEYGDDYGDMELDDLVVYFAERLRKYEENEDRRIAKGEAEAEKKILAKMKAKETAEKNRYENSLIKAYRVRIKNLNKAKDGIETIESVSSFLNFMNNQTTTIELPAANNPRIVKINAEISELEAKIEELKKAKKAKR